jgi:DNA-binding NtrC family response regulator
MAKIDGVAFYEEMEKLGIAKRFVLMTGGAYTERAQNFVARGVCPTIDKPFLFDELLALLERVGSEHLGPS